MDTQNKKRVLIVEDDRALRMILQEKFQHDNYETLIAGDGEEGLKVALKELPDIVLLDIVMPKMNGIEMLKLLRQSAWGKNVPVLFLTNVNEPEQMMNALKGNANDYLIKSDWGLTEIINKVNELLNV